MERQLDRLTNKTVGVFSREERLQRQERREQDADIRDAVQSKSASGFLRDREEK